MKPQERSELQKALLEAQRPDGGWSLGALGDWKRKSSDSDGYATGYVLYVLRQAGVKREHPQLARGLAWLESNQTPSGAWAAESVNRARDGSSARTRWVRTFMPDAATAYGVLALTSE